MTSLDTPNPSEDPSGAFAQRWLLGVGLFLPGLIGIDLFAWLVMGRPVALAPAVLLHVWWAEALHLLHLVLMIAAGVLLTAAAFWLPWVIGGITLRAYRSLRHR